jgi:hypothetical protein
MCRLLLHISIFAADESLQPQPIHHTIVIFHRLCYNSDYILTLLVDEIHCRTIPTTNGVKTMIHIG